MQSVPIATDVVSLNLDQGEVYKVIKFFSDLRLVGGFSPGTPVSSTNKTDRHNIAEISLKAKYQDPNPITHAIRGIDYLHLPTLILKSCNLQELFPFKTQIFNKNNIFFP